MKVGEFYCTTLLCWMTQLGAMKGENSIDVVKAPAVIHFYRNLYGQNKLFVSLAYLDEEWDGFYVILASSD